MQQSAQPNDVERQPLTMVHYSISSEQTSIFEQSQQHIQEYKWIKSEQCGYDVGPQIAAAWYSEHWLGFCRECRLQHVTGLRLYTEFDASEFGLIPLQQLQRDNLCREIIELLRMGHENLGVVNWALDHKIDMDVVISILEQIDINRSRLKPPISALV